MDLKKCLSFYHHLPGFADVDNMCSLHEKSTRLAEDAWYFKGLPEVVPILKNHAPMDRIILVYHEIIASRCWNTDDSTIVDNV